MRLLLAVLAVALAPPVQAGCRQALALGLDVSGSVDAQEYRLQMDGVAGALLRPEVQEAILAFPDAPIRFYVFEWAGPGSLRAVLPWRDLADAPAIADAARQLRQTTRIQQDPSTAIGRAMLHGAHELMSQSDCWRHTLDLSGDGKSNTGPRPREVHRDTSMASITINALAIGTIAQRSAQDTEITALAEYFEHEVIHGPDAFVELAFGFHDFENAMARKLLRELESMAVTQLAPAHQAHLRP